MKFLGRALTGLLLLALTLAFLGAGVWRMQQARETAAGGKSRPAVERSYTVDAADFKSGQVSPVINVYGEVIARRTLELRAPATGAIASMDALFRDGETVTAGQELLRIDPADAESRVAEADVSMSQAKVETVEAEAAVALVQAEIAAAERQVELRKRELDRQKQLLAKGLVPRVTVENAELAVSSAEQALTGKRQQLLSANMRVDNAALAVKRASINVKDSDTGLNETTVTAPFSGRLSEVTATTGRRVGNNEKLGVLIDPNALEVRFNVRDDVFGRLVNDQGQLRPLEVKVALSLGDRSVEVNGTLDRDAPIVDSTQGGRVVYARLEPDTGTLVRPGDFVEVSVAEPSLSNVFSVPAAAVSENDRIFVLDADNRLDEISVNVIRRYGDTVVLSQAPVGQRYVTARLPQLGSGIRVKVRGADKAASGGAAPSEFVELDPERRAKLIAFVEKNTRMPKDRRERILQNLAKPQVKRSMVERIEARM